MFIKGISFIHTSLNIDIIFDALSVPFALLNADSSKETLASVTFHLKIAAVLLQCT